MGCGLQAGAAWAGLLRILEEDRNAGALCSGSMDGTWGDPSRQFCDPLPLTPTPLHSRDLVGATMNRLGRGSAGVYGVSEQ